MYTTTSTSVRPCYMGQDHGLASLTDMDHHHHRSCGNKGFVSRSTMTTMGYATSSTLRNNNNNHLPVSSSPRSGGRFYDARFEDHHQPHFLQACSLCNKPLADNRDIFMYRGDTPFCSEECREEQIEIDEAKEKNRNVSSSVKALRRNKEQRRKSASPNKAQQGYSFRTGAVAAA